MKTPTEKRNIREMWNEIKGKAHLYATAKIIGSPEYQYVALLGIITPGTFIVRLMDGSIEHRACNDLETFCL